MSLMSGFFSVHIHGESPRQKYDSHLHHKLHSDRQTIGRNFVEIYPGSRTEYYSAIASVSPLAVKDFLKNFLKSSLTDDLMTLLIVSSNGKINKGIQCCLSAKASLGEVILIER